MSSRLAALLRAELAPTPRRWRTAALTALGTALALGVAVTLQLGSFVAPVMAYIALQPTSVCTWRNLFRRVLLCAGAAVVVIHLGGIAVQLPWLLLPLFFVQISAVSYFVSLTSRPLEALAVMYSLIMVHFTGVFAPLTIGSVELEVVSAYAVGILIGTAFARLVEREPPHDGLSAALSASLRGARQRLQAISARYRAVPTPPPESPPSLAAHLQLFDLMRQEQLGAAADAAFLAFMLAAERIHLCLTVADNLTADPVGHQYRRSIDDELAALVARIDAALAAAERAAADPLHLRRETSWPDLSAAVAALRQRQLDLRHAGALDTIEVGEAANTNAFAQTLEDIAEVLHVPPGELVRQTEQAGDARGGGPARFTMERIDPYTARWAMQVGLAVTLTFVIVVVSHVPALFTALWNPLFIAQSSYGATIRKAGLRVAGVVCGGLLALLTIILVMPNITDVTALMAVCFAVILPCQYVALGSPRIAYAGLQTAFTYLIVLVANGPTVDVHTALWRAFGTLVGTACLFLVFRLVAPDYAGRQVVARFRDLVRSILLLWPEPDAAALSDARLDAVRRDIVTGAADILRLADEARIEGSTAGVDPDAAVDAVGLASRVAYRSRLIAYERTAAELPPLSAELGAARQAAETAVRRFVHALLDVVDARHTTAAVGSRAHRAARDAAASQARQSRPDPAAAIRAFIAQVDALRLTELADWPPSATSALFAEVAHLHRIGELLPRLDARLIAMCLPPQAADPRRATRDARQVAPLPAGT